jgi:hypothetical protein
MLGFACVLLYAKRAIAGSTAWTTPLKNVENTILPVESLISEKVADFVA